MNIRKYRVCILLIGTAFATKIEVLRAVAVNFLQMAQKLLQIEPTLFDWLTARLERKSTLFEIQY